MSGPYRVIQADPPWSFEVWNPETGHGRSAERHYGTLDLDGIKALKPPATDDAALFLWATWPTIQQAFELIEAWGFAYRTIAWVWAKLNPSGIGFHTGMGYYTRANTEPCLLAVRGSMPVAAHDVSALLVTPIQEHSRKPDDSFAKIERLYPEGPYLNMFARREREGWDAFGNEVENSIKLDVGKCV